jgi:hypothetical protein
MSDGSESESSLLATDDSELVSLLFTAGVSGWCVGLGGSSHYTRAPSCFETQKSLIGM